MTPSGRPLPHPSDEEPPDNLRSGVSDACFYDPEINPSYRDLASHYGTIVLPTRVRKPRDKAKVEAAVLAAHNQDSRCRETLFAAKSSVRTNSQFFRFQKS